MSFDGERPEDEPALSAPLGEDDEAAGAGGGEVEPAVVVGVEGNDRSKPAAGQPGPAVATVIECVRD